MPTKSKLLTRLKHLHVSHKARHSPTGFEFSLFDRVRYAPAKDWDLVTSGHSIFLQRKYLQVLDNFPPQNVRPAYALIYKNELPVGAVVTQCVSISPASIPRGDTTTAKKPPAILDKLSRNVLVCGNLLSWGAHGTAFVKGQKESELWPAVAEALYRIRRSNKLFGETSMVMIKDVDGKFRAGGAALSRFSYRPFPTEPNMVLSIDSNWKTFDDYLGALRKDYRKAATKVIDSMNSQGFRIRRLRAAEMEAHNEKIHSLYKSVLSNQKLRLASLHSEFLLGLAKTFGADFHTNAIWDQAEQQILGFITIIKDGEGAVGYYIGFDREQAKESGFYFRLMQSAVESGIEMGARWISFGRTALEAKARLGAKPEAMQCYIRHRIPALNMALRGLLEIAPEPDDAPDRNTFKK